MANASELTAAERATIDGMALRLAGTTFYELLGVASDADRRSIRDAYFALSKRFHPDAYFGRLAGPYAEQLEHIFRELTRAYDVLSNKRQRAEYDTSLGLDPNRSLTSYGSAEASSPPAAVTPETKPTIPEKLPSRERSILSHSVTSGAPAASQSTAPSSIAHSAAAGSSSALSGPSSAPLPPPKPTASSDDLRAAREAMARKLAGTRTLSGNFAALTPPSVAPPESRQSLESLHRQLAQRPEVQALARFQELIARAEMLLRTHEALGAFNTIQMIPIAELSEPLAVKVRALEQSALAQLVPQNCVAARKAETEGQTERAAALWARVTRAMPNHLEAQLRLAHTLLKIGRDLPGAMEAARLAIALSPASPDGWVVLAEIFEAGGKRASARGAAESAAKLSPSSQTVKLLLTRLR
ncbi:MAG: J domain-containing protein [Deltaproteobacteria bacterium]|nr:J domain-containing protein [Deltaproteobacteria bacterium]